MVSELTDYIRRELIQLDYGCEYGDIGEPTMAQLYSLKGLIEQQLYILRNEQLEKNDETNS